MRPRIQKRPRVNKSTVIFSRSMDQIVGEGLLAVHTSLFDYCVIAQKRMSNTIRIIQSIENDLTSDRTIDEIKRSPTSIKFQYYEAFSKILINLTNYMERIYLLVSDQTKFNIIKDKLEKVINPIKELENKSVRVQLEEGKEVVDNVLVFIQDEMHKRSSQGDKL